VVEVVVLVLLVVLLITVAHLDSQELVEQDQVLGQEIVH
tara:strand:- start:145 stop:261 length:117 start_codon:yes stop_codon:yes gene_type:complete